MHSKTSRVAPPAFGMECLDPPPVLPTTAPSGPHLLAIARFYEAMNIAVMRTLVARWDSRGLIDTKLDLMTGEDYLHDDVVRGHDAVYGWIQGRGLEALAGHCAWLRRSGLEPGLREQMHDMLSALLGSVQRMRVRFVLRLMDFILKLMDFILKFDGFYAETTDFRRLTRGASGSSCGQTVPPSPSALVLTLMHRRSPSKSPWPRALLGSRTFLQPKGSSRPQWS